MLNDLAIHFFLIMLALNYLFGEKAMKEEYMFEVGIVLKLEEMKKAKPSCFKKLQIKK